MGSTVTRSVRSVTEQFRDHERAMLLRLSEESSSLFCSERDKFHVGLVCCPNSDGSSAKTTLVESSSSELNCECNAFEFIELVQFQLRLFHRDITSHLSEETLTNEQSVLDFKEAMEECFGRLTEPLLANLQGCLNSTSVRSALHSRSMDPRISLSFLRYLSLEHPSMESPSTMPIDKEKTSISESTQRTHHRLLHPHFDPSIEDRRWFVAVSNEQDHFQVQRPTAEGIITEIKCLSNPTIQRKRMHMFDFDGCAYSGLLLLCSALGYRRTTFEDSSKLGMKDDLDFFESILMNSMPSVCDVSLMVTFSETNEFRQSVQEWPMDRSAVALGMPFNTRTGDPSDYGDCKRYLVNLFTQKAEETGVDLQLYFYFLDEQNDLISRIFEDLTHHAVILALTANGIM